jgi:uncharacterized membrane protein SpoIIM required for sporulation
MPEPLPDFVARRKPDWDALDALLTAQRAGTLSLPDVEALDGLYRRTSADLALAQALYAGTDAHRYLNDLCARGFGQLHRPRVDRAAAVRAFFASEFPATVRANLRFVAASAALFLGGVLVGALLILWDPAAGEALIPEAMKEVVRGGKLWTDDLFRLGPPSVLAAGIATNNLAVIIATFAGGVFAGLGSAYLLLFNGVHLGSVFAYCARAHLSGRLFEFIGAHGPVELSIIVLSGAAGLKLGHALIAASELPRREALSREGAEAVRIVLGCAPFLAAIAAVEGFVSPGTLFPAWVKLLLGLCLGGLFWTYLLASGNSPTTSRWPLGKVSTTRRSR